MGGGGTPGASLILGTLSGSDEGVSGYRRQLLSSGRGQDVTYNPICIFI